MMNVFEKGMKILKETETKRAVDCGKRLDPSYLLVCS